jgi:hypothetical protein
MTVYNLVYNNEFSIARLNQRKDAEWFLSSRKSQTGAVVARPSPVQEVRGSSPVRDKDFRVRMRRPNYLGRVTLTSFGWDDKPRSSVCTHSEHQARTIKIPQSLCVSHKIVETYRKSAYTVYLVWSLPVMVRIELDLQNHWNLWNLSLVIGRYIQYLSFPVWAGINKYTNIQFYPHTKVGRVP